MYRGHGAHDGAGREGGLVQPGVSGRAPPAGPGWQRGLARFVGRPPALDERRCKPQALQGPRTAPAPRGCEAEGAPGRSAEVVTPGEAIALRAADGDSEATLSSTLRLSATFRRKRLGLDDTRQFVDGVSGPTMHALRAVSGQRGPRDVAGRRALHSRDRAGVRGGRPALSPKSEVKQVDRSPSSSNLVVDAVLQQEVQLIVGTMPAVVIALDWTDFEADKQVTLCACVVTHHGRATPWAWQTVPKSTLKGEQTELEFDLVERCSAWTPQGTEARLLADRGSGSQQLHALLQSIGWTSASPRGSVGKPRRLRGLAGPIEEGDCCVLLAAERVGHPGAQLGLVVEALRGAECEGVLPPRRSPADG